MDNSRKNISRVATWADRVVRMDTRFFLKSFSYLSLNQAVGISSALILALAYAHFLPKETYGTYKYVLAILGTVSVFALTGMDSAAQKWIAAGKEGVFWTTFRKRLEWSGVAVAVGLGVGIYYFLHGNMLLAYSFFVASPFLLVLDPFSHFNNLLVGRQHYKTFSYYSAGIQAFTAACILIAVILTTNVITILAVYYSSFVLARGLAFWHIVSRMPPNNERGSGAVRYGAHLSIISVISIGAGQADVILLFHFLGPVALAVYSFGQAAADQARKLFKIVTSVMAFPKLASMEKERIKRELPHKILVAHLATIPLALLLALIIPPFYHLFFPTYLESIPYAQAMGALLAFSPIRLLSTAISAKGSIRDIYTMNLTASVLQIIALFILVPMFGIWGAILATPLQTIVTNLYSWRIFKRM